MLRQSESASSACLLWWLEVLVVGQWYMDSCVTPKLLCVIIWLASRRPGRCTDPWV